MTDDNSQNARRRQRSGPRRNPATREAIFAAVAALLQHEAYADISIERIAAEAKVSKHSIYRWWNSKGAVILDAFVDDALKRAAQSVLTDDAVADLESFVTRAHRAWRDPIFAKGLRGLIAEMSFDPELRHDFNVLYVAKRKQLLTDMVQRGVDSGQLRPDLDVPVVVDLLFGHVWFRISFDEAGGDEAEAARRLMAVLRPALEEK